MIIATLLGDIRSDAPALLAPGRLTFDRAELNDQVTLAATALAGAGVGRGDRVVMVLANGPEAAVAFLAVACQAVAAPLNPGCTAAEFDFYLEDLHPRVVLVEEGSASPVIDVARNRGIPVLALAPMCDAPAGSFTLTGVGGPGVPVNTPAADDVALVLHTSGTTGKPKLVPLTHAKLCASAANVAGTLELTAADRGLIIMPLFHIHGLVAGLLAPLLVGGSVCCTAGLNITAFGSWLDDVEPTWLTAVPTMLQVIRDWASREPEAARHTNLRFFRSCSAALAPTVAKDLEAAFGVPVVEAYAMTEAAHQMTCNPLPPAEHRFGSVGRAAGPEVAILGTEGQLLPAGETGEVVVRGANVMHGYHENAQANAEAFVRGWFRTGDLGALDADGYLWLSGRLKEMINRGGEKISPIEIENVLLTHAAIAEAVAFCVPHSSLGEDVGAAIVLREGMALDAAAVRAFVQSRLSLPKVPRRIVFAPALPKGPTGKLRRIGMARLLGIDGNERAAFVAPRSALETDLAALWATMLAAGPVGIDDDFFDLGGNSLTALQIANEVQRLHGVSVPISDFLRCPTIAGLAGAIVEQQAGALPPDILKTMLAELKDPSTAKS
ncbi:MAG: non-ribosomal peptide synthetase [Sphingomonas sp.]